MREFETKGKSLFQIVGNVFVPVLLYYVIHNAVVIAGLSVLEVVQNRISLGRNSPSVLFYVETFIKMAGMAIGGLAVLPYYKKEKSFIDQKSLSVKVMAGLVAVGAILSLGINFLFSVIGFTESSEQYQQVAEAQFALPLWLAVLFYGILSPVVEETVFRGVVYNGLSRNMTEGLSIIGSALLFGAFHGNVVQMIYASIMGVGMAWIYRMCRNLWAPILFHGAANIAIYFVSYFF